MFGVVPKVLWEPICDVDDQNRILLATRTLLAVNKKQGRILLVDTGCGSKWEPDMAERFAVKPDLPSLPAALRKIGASEEDVTDVVISHLHFDHNGGLTYWSDGPQSPVKLVYANAKHWIHADHWAHATRPHNKDKASFIAEDFAMLAGSANLQLLDGEQADASKSGFAWFASNGHTPCQLHPIFASGEGELVFSGDIVPTQRHLRPAWVMAYDVLPMSTIDEKLKLYERCLGSGSVLAFPHDPETAAVRLGGRINKPEIEETLNLD